MKKTIKKKPPASVKPAPIKAKKVIATPPGQPRDIKKMTNSGRENKRPAMITGGIRALDEEREPPTFDDRDDDDERDGDEVDKDDEEEEEELEAKPTAEELTAAAAAAIPAIREIEAQAPAIRAIRGLWIRGKLPGEKLIKTNRDTGEVVGVNRHDWDRID